MRPGLGGSEDRVLHGIDVVPRKGGKVVSTFADADEVVMRSIDALGMNCRIIKDGEKYGLRLPFETPAVGRKEVKEQIVLMTKAAAASESS